MAYVDLLDPTTPTGANYLAEGDDRLRELKRALIERLLTFFEDLDDDPLVPIYDQIPKQIISLPLAQQPNPPERAQILFISTDTDQQFISVPDPDNVGEFKWQEIKKTQSLEVPIFVISAGEARFAPEEDESHATRVKNAIISAKLSSSPVRVVFIPKSFWGYVADADYDQNMYEPSVLLVREGSMVGWYDPIAYGADPTGNVNSARPIDVCFSHADAEEVAGSNSPVGMRAVAFTIPGTYTMNTDVDQRDCARITFPGAEVTGTGEFTGDAAWIFPDVVRVESLLLADRPAGSVGGDFFHIRDKRELHAWNETVPAAYDVFQTRNFRAFTVALGAAAVETLARPKELVLRIRGNASGTELVLNWASTGLNADYPLANLLTIVAQQVEMIGVTGSDKGDFSVSVDTGAGTITFGGLASGTNTEFDVYMTFTV